MPLRWLGWCWVTLQSTTCFSERRRRQNTSRAQHGLGSTVRRRPCPPTACGTGPPSLGQSAPSPWERQACWALEGPGRVRPVTRNSGWKLRSRCKIFMIRERGPGPPLGPPHAQPKSTRSLAKGGAVSRARNQHAGLEHRPWNIMCQHCKRLQPLLSMAGRISRPPRWAGSPGKPGPEFSHLLSRSTSYSRTI